jgi:FkbM family methyltransferase
MRAVKIQFKQEFYAIVGQNYEKSLIDRVFEFNFFENRPLHDKLWAQLAKGYLNEGDVGSFMVRMVKPGDTVIDVGANIGFYSMLLSALVTPEGIVHAFEPAEENIAEIRNNMAKNQFTNINVHQKLLGANVAEVVDFHYDQNDSGNSYASVLGTNHSAESRKLFTHTLNHELVGINKIKLVKIDVEGFEVEVLKGAEDLLKKNVVKYWIVEYAAHCLRRNGQSLDSLRSYMAQFGLSMFVLDYEGGFPKQYPPNVQLTGQFLNNLLFANPLELGEDWVFDDTTFLSSPHKWFQIPAS